MTKDEKDRFRLLVDHSRYAEWSLALSTDDRYREDLETLRRIRERLPRLLELRGAARRREVDGFYRFYHQSVKVACLRSVTESIALELQSLSRGRPLHPWFAEVINAGSTPSGARGIVGWPPADEWPTRIGPMLTAFFHAKMMVELACKYAQELEERAIEERRAMPSGWATLGYLFGHR